MTIEPAPATIELDPAAIFAIAQSLWESCEIACKENNWNLSACYNGYDQLMREVMRIANQFEDWSCQHVNFDEFSEVWPYYLNDHFGDACLSIVGIECLMNFGEDDCLRIALALKLPVVADGLLPVPIDMTATNPVPDAGFQKFRIQTVRDTLADQQPMAFRVSHDPFDESFGELYYSLYGVDSDGLLEHIADRNSYAEILKLVQRLVPAIDFPVQASSRT